jgi:AcrR family transcriptional regulator
MGTMPPKPAAVKRRRRYDATNRRAGALRTHEAIVDAAARLFGRDGFQATTIAAVAAEAGVSEETVYKKFRSKAGLVRAIRERGLAGEGPAHAERRSNALQKEERDPRRIIEGWGRLTLEVAPKVMPILQLVAAGAAGDPEMASLRKELDLARLARMRRNARSLARAGHLRAGLRASEAGDVLWACSSPELHDLLVVRSGWPLERYARLIVDVMIGALLPVTPDVRRPRPRRAAASRGRRAGHGAR